MYTHSTTGNYSVTFRSPVYSSNVLGMFTEGGNLLPFGSAYFINVHVIVVRAYCYLWQGISNGYIYLLELDFKTNGT